MPLMSVPMSSAMAAEMAATMACRLGMTSAGAGAAAAAGAAGAGVYFFTARTTAPMLKVSRIRQIRPKNTVPMPMRMTKRLLGMKCLLPYKY